MSVIFLKAFCGVLSTAVATCGGLYAFTDLFVKDKENTSSGSHSQNQNLSKIDIFVSSEEGSIQKNLSDGEKKDIKCKFRETNVLDSEFDCEFFSYAGSENFSNNKPIRVNDFTKKVTQITESQYLNKYQKITVDKQIWDKWSTKENTTKTISIYTSNNVTRELSLLFAVYDGGILTNDKSKKVESSQNKQYSIHIDNIQFIIWGECEGQTC